MMIKAVLIFLALMALVGFIGRALFPSALPRVMRKRQKTPVCGKCGRYLIGEKTCDCGGKAK
jgi:hypothetical protein